MVQDLDIDMSEKDALLAKLNDHNVSDQEKSDLVAEFTDKKSTEIREELDGAYKHIYDDAEAELDQAEKEYNATMKELEDDAKKLNEATDAELDAIPNE